ncbi:MAG: hypothetical protein ACI9AU_000043 [Bacteroidia bacterium]|jgi:hypothetical protein
MKKLVFVLSLSVVVIGTYSCRKPQVPVIDEDINRGSGNGGGGEELTSDYVGTWDYTNIDLKNGTLESMGQDFGTFTGKGIGLDGIVVITENPNIYTTEITFTADVDVVVFGQEQNQQIPVDKQTSSGTWTEDNGEITLTDDNGNKIGILSSSPSKIVFTGNFNNEVPLTPQFVLDANSDLEFTITK